MIIYKSFPALALLVFLACMMSAVGAAQPSDRIEIRDLSSPPETLVVPAGTTVTWVNDDSYDHTVTSDDETFHSGRLSPGEQFSHLFDQTGYYPYHCDAHPSVRGTIQVTSGSYKKASSSASGSYSSAVSEDKAKSEESKYAQYDQVASKPSSASYTTTPEKCEACEMESGSSATPYGYDQKQAQPYSQYQGSAKQQSGGNTLWIQGDKDWTQHATAPLGKRLSLMAVTSTEGDGYLYETYPDGQTVKDAHHFYPYTQLDFYADKIGKHLLSFSVNNQASNSVVVDVVDYNTPSDQKISYPQQNYQAQSYQKQNYQQKDYQQQDYKQNDYNQQNYQQQSYQQQNYKQKVYKQQKYQQNDYKQKDYNQQNYQQQNYQQPQNYQQQNYQQQNYQQQNYQQQNYQQQINQQQNYQQQSYQQPYYNQPSSQPKPVSAAVYPPADYSTFWATSAVKLDSKGYLTMNGVQGADYYLYPSNTNVLTRGLYYNGVSYILIANPNGVPNTVVVNPQMGYWDMQNVQIMYGQSTLTKSSNLLQITAPAYQSAVIIIKPQKKRYSFTAGPKPAYSFRAGTKPAYSSTGGLRQPYSFNAGPKQPYSFRIGY